MAIYKIQATHQQTGKQKHIKLEALSPELAVETLNTHGWSANTISLLADDLGPIQAFSPKALGIPELPEHYDTPTFIEPSQVTKQPPKQVGKQQNIKRKQIHPNQSTKQINAKPQSAPPIKVAQSQTNQIHQKSAKQSNTQASTQNKNPLKQDKNHSNAHTTPLDSNLDSALNFGSETVSTHGPTSTPTSAPTTTRPHAQLPLLPKLPVISTQICGWVICIFGSIHLSLAVIVLILNTLFTLGLAIDHPKIALIYSAIGAPVLYVTSFGLMLFGSLVLGFGLVLRCLATACQDLRAIRLKADLSE